jgi:hypothetical protein
MGFIRTRAQGRWGRLNPCMEHRTWQGRYVKETASTCLHPPNKATDARVTFLIAAQEGKESQEGVSQGVSPREAGC